MRVLIACLLLVAFAQSPALATCTFTTITGPSFSYDPLAGIRATSTGGITVNCDSTSATNVVISLDAGLHSGGSANPWRAMLNSANSDTLHYNLYIDAGYTQIWGDGTNGTGTQSHAQNVGSWSYTIYAQVPSGENASGGTYNDTVTATMVF